MKTMQPQPSFLPATTKLGQGNILTSVCLSTGGVCHSACWGVTPWELTPPPSPGTRHHFPCPRADPPPQTRHPPGADPPPPSRPPLPPNRPPGTRPPSGMETPAYSQPAVGTHTTGMHSCYDLLSQGQGEPWPPRPLLDTLLRIKLVQYYY